MPQTKNLHSKHTKTRITSSPQQNDEDLNELKVLNVKKTSDLESILEPALILEEKTEEDPLAVVEETDESNEEVSLDDEELNPFGDKWEQ